MRIEDIQDYPSLQQLGRSLWHEGSARGAAAFVGAGLSKNAERSPDTIAPPLWQEMMAELANRLYPDAVEKAPTNPLRLAEEYRIYFGRASLDEYIRIRFPDKSWLPGPLHRKLLDLPWADVLTTNWDTLLERAAESQTSRSYNTVCSVADLAHAPAPRIVKLHGTLGVTQHFTFAEEDYRQYPVGTDRSS